MSNTPKSGNESTVRNTAARYNRYGPPEQVVALEELPLPHEPPPGHLRLKMLWSPIHMADMGLITGRYGEKRTPPAVCGVEGLGQVEAVAPDVETSWVGRTLLSPPGQPCWQTRCDFPLDACLPAPASWPVEQAAMASVNPMTALRLLSDFVPLKTGDWILQDGGFSAVARWVRYLSSRRGIKTLNAVRTIPEGFIPDHPELEIFCREEDLSPGFLKQNGAEPARLGLNAKGGESALKLLSCLAPRGTLVTYGGGPSRAIRYPVRDLIFRDVRLRGFWRHRWHRETPAQEVARAYRELWREAETKPPVIPIAGTYPLRDIHKALAHQLSAARQGKVLLQLDICNFVEPE